jgi:tetratricopeptide (TPR) repeat protein
VRAKIWNLKDYKIYLAPVTLLIVLLMLSEVNRAMRDQLTGGMLKRAENYSEKSQWDSAIDLYNRIIRIDPSNGEAIYFRGSSYLDRDSTGDTALALADFTAVQVLKPDYVLVHFKKALALKKLNRVPESRAEMMEAVRQDPGLIYQDPDFLKAEGLAAKRDYKKALPLYQKLVLDYPACVPLLINAANTMVECGLTAPALDLYNRALVYDPGNPDALSNSTAVKKMLGK